MNTKKTITFFGATGGCAGSSLACALREGYYCTALARTPSKLTAFLETEHAIPQSTLSTHLTIIQGDAKNPSDVARALTSPTNKNHVVDTIYSAIGAYPTFQWSLRAPFAMADPSLCTDGIQTIFAALDTLRATTQDGSKPLLIALSSTGVNARTRDLPYLYSPLYRILAAQPHADKRNMEKLIMGDGGRHVRDFVLIRPTLLTDGEAGVEKVRAGWEWGVEGREGGGVPAIGWTVGRKDVGAWIFKEVVEGGGGGWEGKCVSLTY